jgi:hypothetical protein
MSAYRGEADVAKSPCHVRLPKADMKSRPLGRAVRHNSRDLICDIVRTPGVVLGAGEAMRRREFIAFVGSTAVAWPLPARAEQSTVPLIGFLNTASPQPFANYVAGFRAGLKETGYVDGRNVAIEFRWAEGHYDRLPEMAADLVRRKVVVLAATEAHRASRQLRRPLRPFQLSLQSAPTRSSSASSVASVGPAAILSALICSSPRWRVSGLACCARLFREFS